MTADAEQKPEVKTLYGRPTCIYSAVRMESSKLAEVFDGLKYGDYVRITLKGMGRGGLEGNLIDVRPQSPERIADIGLVFEDGNCACEMYAVPINDRVEKVIVRRRLWHGPLCGLCGRPAPDSNPRFRIRPVDRLWGLCDNCNLLCGDRRPDYLISELMPLIENASEQWYNGALGASQTIRLLRRILRSPALQSEVDRVLERGRLAAMAPEPKPGPKPRPRNEPKPGPEPKKGRR